MFKAVILASAIAATSANLALAGGNPAPGPVSEAGTILGTTSVASANQAIAAAGVTGATTLTGTTATVTRTPSGDIIVSTDTGTSFTLSAGYVAQLILNYFS